MRRAKSVGSPQRGEKTNPEAPKHLEALASMRISLTVFVVLALFFSLYQHVLASEVIRVDPNTVPREEQKDFWDLDTRLAQKVTLDARRQTVLAITDDLAKMTGVTLYSGYNSNDWQVRDRKMIIIASDMPLKELMQSIARVMKFKWSRSESEPYTYRIWMDRRTLLDAEGQAYRAEQKFEELLIKRREVLADKMAEAAGVDPAELEKIRDTDPYTYALAKSGFAGSVDQFFQMIPEAREAFANKSQAWISGDRLTGEAQSVAALMAQSMDKLLPHPVDSTEADDPSGPIQVLRVEFNTDPNTSGDPMRRRNDLGSLTMQWKSGSTTYTKTFWLVDPENSMGKGRGSYLRSLLEKEPGSPDPEPTLTPIDMDEWAQSRKDSDFGEPAVEHTPEDYEIFADDSLKNVRFASVENWISAVSEATGMNVVSDYLGKGLSATNTLPSYNWWQHGNILEFRDRYWFKKRSMQIPESYIAPWREHYKENGTLEIDDLTQIAVLTGEQERYEVNINGDEVLGNESMRQAVFQQLRPLRFYEWLDKKQRAALLSDDGLSQDALTPEQREYMSNFSRVGDYTEPLKMTIIRSPGRNDYRVNMFINSLEITQFSIWTPKYEPPKKEDKVSVSGEQEDAL